MLNISVIIVCLTVSLIAFAVLLSLICVLIARQHSLWTALIRLGCVLVAGCLAWMGVRQMSLRIGERFYHAVLPSLGEQVRQTLQAIPAGEPGARLLLSLLLAPILFPLLFLGIYLLLRLVVGLVTRSLIPRAQTKKRSGRVIAGTVGLLHGLLLSFLLLMPLCGFLSLGARAAQSFLTTGVAGTEAVQDAFSDMRTDGDTMLDEAERLTDSLVVKLVERVGGRKLFQAMTTGNCTVEQETGDENAGSVESGHEEPRHVERVTLTLCLEDEICRLAESAGYGIQVAEHMDSAGNAYVISEEDRQLINSLVDSLFSSPFIGQLGSGTVSACAENWLDKKSFMGFNPSDMDPIVEPFFHACLVILSDEDPDELRDDLMTVVDVADILLDGGLMRCTTYNDFMTALGTSGLIQRVMDRLNESRHLAPLASEIKTMGIRAVAAVLQVEHLEDGTYDESLNQMADSLNQVLDLTPEERKETVRDAVHSAFESHEVDVPEDLAVSMAEQAIDSLGEDGDITGDEIKQYLIDHATDIPLPSDQEIPLP